MASGRACFAMQQAFPGKLVGMADDPRCGVDRTVQADVVHSRLQCLRGGASTVELVYDLGAWVALSGVGSGVTVLLRG